MADYKRMVSYMYQYDNGVKKKNVGFARVESRNGQCKITLHMQLLGQLDSIFPTYLILRDDNNIELIYLGDSTLKSQVMDSKLVFNADNVADSGHPLSEMGGLLLFLNDNIFFATEWEDRPIAAQEVLDALKPKSKKVRYQSESLDKEARAEKSAAAIKETKSEEKMVSLKEETDAEEQKKSDEVMLSGETMLNGERAMDLLEELSIPKYKLPRGLKTVERLQNIYHSAGTEGGPDIVKSSEIIEKIYPVKDKQKESSAPVLNENPQEEREENVFNELEASDIIETESMETYLENTDQDEKIGEDVLSEQSLQECAGQEGMASDSPIAESFFEKYPRIYPFEDNEILLCVKIEPKDIGLLPKELWGLSNNSFLLHGYYCYHHLIFAKKKESCGSSYLLGIPGIYHNRELFMARMFGFENFKTIRKREAKMGDFGYWYLSVNL